MIRIENLVKVYGKVRALDGLHLNVDAGVVYGFLGPNGAGKTTTLRILAGLARPTAGKAWVLDKEIGQGSADLRSQVGVLPEEPAFYPWMTAREYLCDFVAPLFGLEATRAARRADELLELCGLGEAAGRRIAGFSRGMRQRLGLAQALVPNPKVLLLDEPVSALDPGGRKDVLQLIESLRGQTTILLSTHILADVERICDVVGIIAHGRMIIQEERAALLARYAQPVFEVEAENGFDTWPAALQQLPIVQSVTLDKTIARIRVSDVARAQTALIASLAASEARIRRFEIVQPSLEDIFLRLTEKEA